MKMRWQKSTFFDLSCQALRIFGAEMVKLVMIEAEIRFLACQVKHITPMSGQWMLNLKNVNESYCKAFSIGITQFVLQSRRIIFKAE